MKPYFSKQKIIRSAVSRYDNYCVGYPYKNGYITGLIVAIDSSKLAFSHSGSRGLDSIVAYDRAETGGAYIGQINMSVVSSFVGPEGLIWGYDIAKEDSLNLPSYLPSKIIKNKFPNRIIKDAENLRQATIALLGTNAEKHFPLLPGSHVPCAAKFRFATGPTCLYATAAIGIPEERNKNACLLMEDMGQIISANSSIADAKQKIALGTIASVLEVGKNQHVNYKTIFVDVVAKEIAAGEIGCALVAVPYFHLAKKAYDEKLVKMDLKQWIKLKKKYFLNS